jgi:predicted nuclease with TOPRIM domain
MDIVQLIETNPITKFSGNYQSRLVGKLRDSFTETQQQTFLTNFYCYLNCSKTEFVIDLDDVWEWMGFSQKSAAKYRLLKYFVAEKDYTTNSLTNASEQKYSNGGQNRQIIKLTVPAFKRFCLKAGTAKADEIHEYYVKLEEVIQETICEESMELQNQLKLTKESAEREKQKTIRAVEKTIIDQFPKNTECVYFGTIENQNEDNGEKLLKFGQTNDLQSRTYYHHGKFTNFVLMNAFKVQNKVEIENLIKTHPKIRKQMRQITVGGKTYKEIIAYNEVFTTDKLTHYIKDIIKSKQYSVDNYNKLLKENERLETEAEAMRAKIDEIQTMNVTLAHEVAELKKAVVSKDTRIDELLTEQLTEPSTPASEETKRFDEFISECCVVRGDVEEPSLTIQGQFRIWNQAKPTKKTFHELKRYLDTRFRAKRMERQDKNQLVHGYAGVKLRPIEYARTNDSDVETYVFNVCRFTPCGRILNSTLLSDYQRWRKRMGKDVLDDKATMKELKTYLNASEYVQKGVVWTGAGSNEGYYGLCLREDDEYHHRITSSTGKRVNKVCVKTEQILNTWETIAKAAVGEKISASKMSQSIKNSVIFGDYTYRVAT